MTRKLIGIATLVVLPPLLVACPAEECRKMKTCCSEVSHLEWVGDSCGELATNVTDPDTCQTILETVRYSFAERQEPVPETCQ